MASTWSPSAPCGSAVAAPKETMQKVDPARRGAVFGIDEAHDLGGADARRQHRMGAAMNLERQAHGIADDGDLRLRFHGAQRADQRSAIDEPLRAEGGRKRMVEEERQGFVQRQFPRPPSRVATRAAGLSSSCQIAIAPGRCGSVSTRLSSKAGTT